MCVCISVCECVCVRVCVLVYVHERSVYINVPFHSYNEALASAKLGQQRMEQLGVSVRRPDDYFAEMVKTDDHMKKVCNVLNNTVILLH